MVNVAILGFGVVGSGAAEVLADNRSVIEKKLGTTVAVKRILDLREFPDSPFGHLVTHDFNEILNDPDISIVAEMMGGSHPAYDFTKACLEAGKSVVTSNKEVVARFGAELLEIAAANGVRYLFEASVGGGIPILRPLVNDLASNAICEVSGILNGTTNYILTQMLEHGTAYEDGRALFRTQTVCLFFQKENTIRVPFRTEIKESFKQIKHKREEINRLKNTENSGE